MTMRSSGAMDEASTTGLAVDAFTATEVTDRSRGLSIKNRDLPIEIRVDEQAYKEVARRSGHGYEVYDCPPPAEPATKGIWKFREPFADLYDLQTGKRRGIHFVGPNWADADGSRVVGTVAATHESPDDPQRGCSLAPRGGHSNLRDQRRVQRCHLHPASTHGRWCGTIFV
jgi:hypothetical protein